MSKAGKTFGTQSPPLEDSRPMGVSSIDGGNPLAVPDSQQREQYFSDEPGKDKSAPEAKPSTVGETKTKIN